MGVLDYNKNIQSDNNKGSEEILTASPNITKVDDKPLTPSTILGSQIAKTSYGLTHLNYKGNKYDEYGVNINPINTEEELNLERAKNQSGFEQIGNSLAQIIENGFADNERSEVLREKYLPLRDNKNRERIYKCVRKKLGI